MHFVIWDAGLYVLEARVWNAATYLGWNERLGWMGNQWYKEIMFSFKDGLSELTFWVWLLTHEGLLMLKILVAARLIAGASSYTWITTQIKCKWAD